MRLWISPELERIALGDGESHSMTVVEDPERYGLDASAVASYMRIVNSDDADCQFDFETVITLAEMAGWVRTSRDSDLGHGEIGVSASDVRRARKAIRSLILDGEDFSGGIVLALERIEGRKIVSEYRILDSEAVDLFAHTGRLPVASRSVSAIEPECFDLIDAVTEARRVAPRPFSHA